MSLLLRCVSVARVESLLVCASTLGAFVACHHRSSAGDQASGPTNAAVTNDRRSDEELRRRFPGVDVIRTPTGGFVVRILSGLASRGEPLYVIDDAPVDVDPRRGIDWLKPEDIAEVRVLTTPSETAVYGPRGVNGVVVITTRLTRSMRKRGR